MLKVENLHKTYHIGTIEVRALQGVSVEIQAGEFVAIMGPSGSGKSTLMHLLGFLDTPDQGSFHFLGRDVSRLSEEEAALLRNQTVGFVFQQFNLMSRSTALENVGLPLLYSPVEKAVQMHHKPEELLKRVGLADRLTHKPNELSGGQQQRVAIARSLVMEPRLILADEPTGNLDSKAGKEIMEILHELHAAGMTIVIVTHDENIGRQAERILRMHDGKIIKDERQGGAAAGKKAAALQTPPPENKKVTFQELKEHLNQAGRMVRSNKLRSLLSMLGVLIGVACVITVLAVGEGASRAVAEELSRLGSNLLSVRPGSTKVRGVAMEAGAMTRLSLDDARAIEETIPEVTAIAPQVTGPGQMVSGNKNWSTQLVGTTPSYSVMRNQQPVAGRFFTEDENISRRRVVVLGQTVARELFGEEIAVGKEVKINRINFQVIGLLPSQGGGGWRDPDDLVVVPLATAMHRIMGKDFLDQIDIQVDAPENVLPAQDTIFQLIVRRQRLTPDRYDTFNIRNYSDIQKAREATTQTFSVLLGSVAIISLLVGGIGIMNIMLVSVKERTREIGLRKAIGGTPRDILVQFLVESLVITFVGGLSGIALGIGLSWLITLLAGWKTVISLFSILLAFIFSAGVGIVFGLWPAREASRLDPIRALRYE